MPEKNPRIGDVFCSAPGCPNKFRNHAWGRIKSDTWFHQKNGDHWCPDHIPEWVAEWRENKSKENENV